MTVGEADALWHACLGFTRRPWYGQTGYVQARLLRKLRNACRYCFRRRHEHIAGQCPFQPSSYAPQPIERLDEMCQALYSRNYWDLQIRLRSVGHRTHPAMK